MPVPLIAAPATPDTAFARVLEDAWAAGEAVLPLDPGLPPAARDGLLEGLQPTVLRLPGRPDQALAGRGVPAGTAFVVATSGTTGRPKGVVLSHAALDASADGTLARLGDLAAGGWLCPLPLHHVAGLQVLRRAARAGTHARILAGAEPDDLVAAGEDRVVSLVPTQLRRLLDHGAGVERFAAVLLGGAKPDPAVLARARELVPVIETYGATETCGGCVYDGTPLPGVDVRLGAGGRIALRGPMLATAYRGALEGPVADEGGWFATGDRGRWDAGRLEVLGRLDSVIVTGGVNVAAEDVEAVLVTHPAVDEVAVVGRPDPEWGERVVAVVVAADPDAPPSAETLRAHVRERAPRAWAPREVEVVTALPRTALGKVARTRLSR